MRLSVSGQGTAVGVVWKQAACKGLWANSCTSRGHVQKNSQVRSGHSQSLAGRRDGGMRKSSFASLRWLILVLVFAVCLLYVLNSLCSVDQISALCLLFAFSASPPCPLLQGSKTTAKPWLPPWIRRFQMASWKNKVLLWSGQRKCRKSAFFIFISPPIFILIVNSQFL